MSFFLQYLGMLFSIEKKCELLTQMQYYHAMCECTFSFFESNRKDSAFKNLYMTKYTLKQHLVEFLNNSSHFQIPDETT